MIVRQEKGVINRSGYIINILHDPAAGPVPTYLAKGGSAWNGKLIYSFGPGAKAGYHQGRGFGDRDWIDLVAVTNANGEFEMAYSKPAKAMILEVAPRGMAPKLVALPTGPGKHAITVTAGATIRGRLMANGKPVANAEFGLKTFSSAAGTTFPEIRIGTNDKGEFVITNVPAGRIWDLYATMDSLAPKNLSARIVNVATKDDGQEVDVGDIVATPAYTLKGRVQLSTGEPIPLNMRLSLFAARLPDRQALILPPDGAFEFKGLAKGVYILNPTVKGYQPPDPEQPRELLIEGDRKDFHITLYPGTRR